MGYLKRFTSLLFTMLTLFCAVSCQQDLYHLPTYSSQDFVQAVIEIPAGTNHKYEINPESGQFEIELINGKERVVAYLPYPGNYGFIPGTMMDAASGGDGDALDVLVISEHVPTGTVVEIIPVGLLQLIDQGEDDFKLIAVPADKSMRIVDCFDLECIEKDYPAVLEQIEKWFTSYKKKGGLVSKGFLDEQQAHLAIDRYKN